METVKLLGLEFDNLNVHGVVDTLLERPAGWRFGYVVTPNIDHIVRLRRRPALQKIYDKAWLRLLDSQFLKNSATVLGVAAPGVTTGADITMRLLAALEPQTVAVIGLDPSHLRMLQARYPQLNFMHHAPPMNLMHNKMAFMRACEFALITNARFTFIALGSPVQELLAYTIAMQPNATGTGLCIGAALEYCAGAKRRAPVWMQVAGLEWLHRLVREPKRLARRYLVDDIAILPALLTEALRAKIPSVAANKLESKT